MNVLLMKFMLNDIIHERLPIFSDCHCATVTVIVCGLAKKKSLGRGAHEQQIWKVISREILNLSRNAKICISKNMALFLYVFRIGPCF